jgi:hypothetical protein
MLIEVFEVSVDVIRVPVEGVCPLLEFVAREIAGRIPQVVVLVPKHSLGPD